MNEETDVMETPEMEESFNRHFIRIDERGRIVRGFSDVPEFHNPPPQDGETDVLINDRGGRHFRLLIDGGFTEENPAGLMFDEQGVPLLEWDAKNGKILRRAEREIRADIDAIQAAEPAAPVEERLKRLENTAAYHEKAIEVILDTLPKAQRAHLAQVQQAMLGAVHDG